MTTEFSLVTNIDEGDAVLSLTVSGPIDSRRFVDESMAFFKTISTPWMYDRINDLREADGFVLYEDLTRMAAYWSSLAGQFTRQPRVAVVTNNKLVAARMPIIDRLNPQQSHRTFEDISEAREWLRSKS